MIENKDNFRHFCQKKNKVEYKKSMKTQLLHNNT